MGISDKFVGEITFCWTLCERYVLHFCTSNINKVEFCPKMIYLLLTFVNKLPVITINSLMYGFNIINANVCGENLWDFDLSSWEFCGKPELLLFRLHTH